MIDHVREALEELMAVKALKKQAERLRREGMARNAETLDGEYERRKPLAWAAAKAALAAPTAEPTTSYVQPVPDKCDRITWRGEYYHLPLAAPAQQVVEPPQMMGNLEIELIAFNHPIQISGWSFVRAIIAARDKQWMERGKP